MSRVPDSVAHAAVAGWPGYITSIMPLLCLTSWTWNGTNFRTNILDIHWFRWGLSFDWKINVEWCFFSHKTNGYIIWMTWIMNLACSFTTPPPPLWLCSSTVTCSALVCDGALAGVVCVTSSSLIPLVVLHTHGTPRTKLSPRTLHYCDRPQWTSVQHEQTRELW